MQLLKPVIYACNLTYVPEIQSYVPDDQMYIVKEIRNEILDTRFTGRTHGKRATRNKGCNGPMCRKVLRDTIRARVRTLAHAEGREVSERTRSYQDIDPLIDKFMKLTAEDQLALQRA